MKSLFYEDGASKHRYGEDAIALSNEVDAFLKPIFEKYIAMGYSPREISHVIQLTSFDWELTNILFL